MKLPEAVLDCLNALEGAGFEAWAVGGCVRDHCLGRIPQDYDLCTSALPEQTEAVFAPFPLVTAGKKHGTVGVVRDGQVVEITTFRAEGGYGDNRHPDWVEFVPRLEQDLARRDFTVNAMAFHPGRGIADPFGGQADLAAGLLRAVGDPTVRFQEDSLRILRGVRFAVRFGLQVEPATQAAMAAQAPLMAHLARERVYDELCKLLPLVTAGDLVRFQPVLCQVIPELAPLAGYDQGNSHHAYDLYTHTALAVEHCPPSLPLRWAALLHDIGKPACRTLDEGGQAHYHGHAACSAQLAEDILRRLKAPTALREEAVALIRRHMTLPEPDKKYLRRQLGRLGWDGMEALLQLQRSDTLATGTDHEATLRRLEQASALLEALRRENACLTLKDLAVNGHDLLALGYQGRAIGQTLNRLLELVLEEQCPNTRPALLGWLQDGTKEDSK